MTSKTQSVTQSQTATTSTTAMIRMKTMKGRKEESMITTQQNLIMKRLRELMKMR